jgi:DNA polymerase-3 subunit epsilon
MTYQAAGRLLAGRGNFVAIDFETADHGQDSACAIGLVRVEGWQVVQRAYSLIRPPRQHFFFSYLHGITWAHVRDQAAFDEVWRKASPLLEDADFLAAHNASFDRGVLRACCAAAGMQAPTLPFECSLQLARRVWGFRPARLSHVCARLGLPLKHHHAGSDADACAGIVLAARHALRAGEANPGGARSRPR